MNGRVLVVEDDPDVRDLVRRYLGRAGFGVTATGSGAEAAIWLHEGSADLVILDLGLPDVPGEDLLDLARRRGVPVVVLTARCRLEDRLHGLELGADDYMAKPFSPRELVLRVKAVLRRGAPIDDHPQGFADGRLVIDTVRHEARLDGTAIPLTPSEWELLTVLSSVPGRAFSRSELVARVRGCEYAGYERTIDTHVKNLRRKLALTAGHVGIVGIVETVNGVGYRLGVDRDD